VWSTTISFGVKAILPWSWQTNTGSLQGKMAFTPKEIVVLHTSSIQKWQGLRHHNLQSPSKGQCRYEGWRLYSYRWLHDCQLDQSMQSSHFSCWSVWWAVNSFQECPSNSFRKQQTSWTTRAHCELLFSTCIIYQQARPYALSFAAELKKWIRPRLPANCTNQCR